MTLEFENKIYELEKQIISLKGTAASDEDIKALEDRLHIMIDKIYQNITPWQRVLVARHHDRPRLYDYLSIFTNLFEFKGDRRMRDDQAIYTGIGKFKDKSIAIIGHNKGSESLEDKIKSNFGMANPAGYYKAMRMMRFAENMSLPIIYFIDTPGAAAGMESEEQGQFIAISECMSLALSLQVPSIAIIIGEGGSGGAIALSIADRILMLENAIYSVISPEGCSSILWKNTEYKEQAAEALKLSSHDLLEAKMIDRIVYEPIGGAHRKPKEMISHISETLWEEFNTLSLTDKNRFL